MDTRTDNNNKANEQTKEDLLRELQENLDIDIGANREKPIPKNDNEIKASLSTIPEASIEISCIEPLKGQKVGFDRNEDSTILNIFGDDDENDNLVSFYGPNGDLENLVNNLDLKKSEPTGFLSVVNFYKVSNEHLSKLTQSINQKDLLACKKIMDKIEFDGKMVTKINDLKFLLMKSKDISNDDMDDILNNKDYLNDLFGWRDMLPGEDSFYRSIMFGYLEYLILNNDFENYKTFLYDLSLNISDKYFSKILAYYQIDITKVKISLALIYYAINAGNTDNYIEKALHLFMKTYNMDMNFDLLLILNLKFVIYKYLKLNEKKKYSREKKVKIGEFLPTEYTKKGNYNFKDFYENELLPLGKNVANISISVIPFIFKRNLYIYSFENKKIKNVFYQADSKENKEAFPFRIIILNGSYNLIYDRPYYAKFLKIFSLYSNISKSSVNINAKEKEREKEKEKKEINENVKKEGMLRFKPLTIMNPNNNITEINPNNNIANINPNNNIINNYQNNNNLNNTNTFQNNNNTNNNFNNQNKVNNNFNPKDFRRLNSQNITNKFQKPPVTINTIYNQSTINNNIYNGPNNQNKDTNQKQYNNLNNQNNINNNNNNNEIPNLFKDMSNSNNNLNIQNNSNNNLNIQNNSNNNMNIQNNLNNNINNQNNQNLINNGFPNLNRQESAEINHMNINMNNNINNINTMNNNIPNNMINNFPNNYSNKMNNNINNINNNMNNNMNANINNNMNVNINNNMNNNINSNMNNINNNINNNVNNINNNMNNIQNNMNNVQNNNMNNMNNIQNNINNIQNNNMNNIQNNNMNNNQNNMNNITNNMNNIMNNNMNITFGNINNNMINSNNNINNISNLESSQTKININTNANTVVEESEGYSSTQFEGSNLNINNYINQTYQGNVSNISQMMNQSMGRECPLCKKPNKDNFYCENCLLSHLIPYTQNNYITFLKNNINYLIQQKNIANIVNFNMFLPNLSIVFPNGITKSFYDCYYLISDQNKNFFNEQLDNFKTSICLGCFNFLDKNKNEYVDNLFFRFPCGCVFCNSNCLNRFLSAIPFQNMNSFICGCGITYDYIQLKYLLYFSISFNLIKLKKEIMRFMYEIIKTKCCKCKKSIERLNKEHININAKELIDQEAERIFNIHKFNHFICEKCDSSQEMQKNKFYCNLCISEHSIVKRLDYQSINNNSNNSCPIY